MTTLFSMTIRVYQSNDQNFCIIMYMIYLFSSTTSNEVLTFYRGVVVTEYVWY
jgi:hypothetical protein